MGLRFVKEREIVHSHVLDRTGVAPNHDVNRDKPSIDPQNALIRVRPIIAPGPVPFFKPIQDGVYRSPGIPPIEFKIVTYGNLVVSPSGQQVPVRTCGLKKFVSSKIVVRPLHVLNHPFQSSDGKSVRAFVVRDGGSSTVRMFVEVVASSGAGVEETVLLTGFDELACGYAPFQTGTSTVSTSMSGGSGRPRSTYPSATIWTTSRMFFRASSRVLPCVRAPLSAGQ